MRISIIGSGNVGTHLAQAFYEAGHDLNQIFSRDLRRASELAEYVDAEPVNNLSQISGDMDVILLAVRDDVIQTAYSVISSRVHTCLVLHTGGSVSIEVFGKHPACGVFWPVQSLSVNHPVDLQEVPIAITGNSLDSLEMIEALASSISKRVYRVDDFQRTFLHLAATFANNFSNHMYALAEKITSENDIPFDILEPLIRETASKINRMSPGEAQTGAAIRDDLTTIRKHLRMLDTEPDIQELYGMITRSIQALHRNTPPS